MISKEVTIINKSGLHARPASLFVKAVQAFKCGVVIQAKGKEYNAKSILGIMSAGIKGGETVTLVFDGADEAEAAKVIIEAIESGLGE